MFSERTNWKLTQNKITVILERLRRDGEKIIDLTESNPTRCGFSFPSRQILNLLFDPKNVSYDPLAQGGREAREAVCAYYARRGVVVPVERIFLTASTSEAYSFLFRLLVNPREAALFPRPSYPLFEFLVQLNDFEMQHYPLVYEERWRPNLEKFRLALSGKTRAVVLVNPNNPTGSFLHEGELVVINGLCREKGIPLICDEVFLDYVFDEGTVYPSLAANQENLTFTLGGLSKALGLPQMKVSWIVINGPEELVKEAIARLEIIADTYLSVNTPSQNAMTGWLEFEPAIQKEILSRVRQNRRTVEEIFSGGKDGSLLKAEGGWYAVLKLPKNIPEEDLAIALLEHDRVMIHPGYFFDFEEEPYIVISLLPPEAVFEEGIERLVQRIAILKNN
jgi:alanine-synthesizing transaminase